MSSRGRQGQPPLQCKLTHHLNVRLTTPSKVPWFGIRSWVWALLLGAIFWQSQLAAAAEPAVTKEYEIKAAFLYNFTKFVEWPAEKFESTNSPIVIGVLGKNPFGPVLAETVKGRKVNGREIQVRQVDNVTEVKGLHVLFVTTAEAKRFEGQGLGDALKEGAVLGVNESEAFLKNGGTLMFMLEEDKVRFDIDMNSAERAKLRISAQLQKLARTVKRKS